MRAKTRRFGVVIVATWGLALGLAVSACDSRPPPSTAQPGPATALPPLAPVAPPPFEPNGTGTTVVPPTAPPSGYDTVVVDGDIPSLVPYLTRPAPGAGPDSTSAPPPPPRQFDVIRVGILLPFSGQNRGLANAMLNAAQLALFDIADDRFELLPYDTAGTPGGAAVAARCAIADGASLILGPLLASSVEAVAPTARAANVPIISFSSNPNVAGGGVYVMGFTPGADVARVVSFARARGIDRFAAVAPDNLYGGMIVGALQQAAVRQGAMVTDVALYDPVAPDYDAVVRRLAEGGARVAPVPTQPLGEEPGVFQAIPPEPAVIDSGSDAGSDPDDDSEETVVHAFQALLVVAGGARLQAIAAHLPFYDIDPAEIRMLGTGQWDEPGIGREPGLVGGWFAAPLPADRAEFETRYTRIYGSSAPRLATLAYDAAALAALLAVSEEADPYRVEVLQAPSGFAGRDGIFRFDSDGLIERGLAILQVEPDGFRIVSEAARTFEAY